MRRILLPVLAIALAAGGYWLFRSPHDASKTPNTGSAVRAGATEAIGGGKSPETPAGTVDPVAAPIRMRSTARSGQGPVTPVAAQDSVADGYEKEERDSTLAAKHLELVRNTVEELAEKGTGTAHIENLDCRARHCRLQLSSGDSRGLVKLADALQDDRGFLGKAESIMLSRQDDDIVFYLRFSPPK